MPHGDHSHIDLEAELAGKMPTPYCQGRWRAEVTAMGVASLLVLGLALEKYVTDPGSPPEGVGPIATSASPSPLSPPNPMVPANAALTPVAQTSFGPATGLVPAVADANVRLVGTTERTVFNTAARTIRPSVVGIRAVLPSAGARGLEVEKAGSGIIVDGRGRIVTCHHVIAGASRVLVTPFRDSNVQLPAKVVAVEEDLALLEVAGDLGRPPASIGNSQEVQVGDWVLAVGHPFGLGLTVTAGIVGRRRSDLAVPGGQGYTGLLQTDAPINEGSSGGPLVNMAGQVVGVNTAIYAPTGVFSGAGFAIPADRVRAFLARNGVSFPTGRAAPMG